MNGHLPDATTLIDLLRGRAATSPDRPAFTFLVDGEVEGGRLTYGELDRRARALAVRLQERYAPGERVLLLFAPGLDFVAAFFGCLYAGTIAVPVYPPRAQRDQPRLRSILADASPRAALTTSDILARVRSLAEGFPELLDLDWVATDEVTDEGAGLWRVPGIGPGDVAFLQYTSGSTGTPKGVMVGHGNLLHNEEMIRRSFEQSEASVVVGWLPLYHDMGLIGNVLQPVYNGGSCVLMSPAAFLQRPLRWLEAIHRYRGTTSGGPNFAYDLCARRALAAPPAELDLSSWTVAYNGAEPVRAETLDRFSQVFEPHGFRREAFYPCYGLAEATLFVSGGTRGVGPVVAPREEGATPLVGCGRSWMEQEVAVVDPATGERRPDGGVGEIWVGGPSVALGYWNRPEATEETFRARLAGDGAGPFLRTGDLGFFQGGELFVTGRIKDLVIIRGRNHYPQDIELTAEASHASLKPGGGAAFAVDVDGEERLVVVHEVERRADGDPDAACAAVRQAVAAAHEVQVHEVVLIRVGTLPKTSSGKVQRHATRAAYLAGSLHVVARSAVAAAAALEPLPGGAEGEGFRRGDLLALPPADREAAVRELLARQVARLTGARPEDLRVDLPLAAAGLDSLAAIQLGHAAETALGVPVAMSDLLEGVSLSGLVRRLLRELEEGSGETRPALTPDGGTEGLHRTTYGQRALWFLERMGADGAYNVVAAMRLRSAVGEADLHEALRGLVRRHPALRTTLEPADGAALQRVHEWLEPGFTVEDGAEAAEAADDADWIAASAYAPFDLEHGPLLRLHVRRAGAAGSDGAEGPLLVLAVHHTVSDFWSLGVMVRDLAALAAGQAPPPEPALRATEFARWQERLLAGAEGERLWEAWRAELAGRTPNLDLPLDRPRPPLQTYRGGALPVRLGRLGGERLARLLETGREAGATPFMTLLAVFQTLLHRYSGQDVVVCGSPTAGRTAAELARVVGYFVNPVVLRGDLAGEPSFSELLGRVRRTALAAFSLQEMPFPLLAERLQPQRDPSRSPLFQVMFVLQKAHDPELRALDAFALREPGHRLEIGGLVLESVEIPDRRPQFDLALTAVEVDGEVRGSLEYNADLFDAATVERMARHLENLAGAAAVSPGLPVGLLPLMDESESWQALRGWNQTAREYPASTLHGLFEEQAERTPDAVALVCEDEQVTYRELRDRAWRLARHLEKMGVGPDERAGVFMERSNDMVVALFGALAAGGAYVPLDPSYPKDRLAYMVEDSRVPVVLSQRHLLSDLPETSRGSARRLCVDADWPLVAGEPAVRLPREPAGGNLAYVIYTSGSTGRPKGAMNTHAGIVNRLLWMQEEYGLDGTDRVLQKTPFSFDVSVWEFFWPLLAGATLVMARPGGHRDSAYLVDEIARRGITTLHFVPSMLQVFLEDAARQPCASLRRVICSGEALPAELAERFFERLDCSLHNLYGPTEAAVDVTYWACEPGGRRSVPIGRPIANIQIYLVDRRFEPVPVGIPGELLIGGVGLARGYHGLPELTAERFVPDPFAAEPGARVYRTGDLTRRGVDGEVEFLGRLDFQVKIRGFRIELGEVEAALAQHPAVREAVVLAHEAATGDRRLIAYVVPRREPAPTPAELQAALRERLPDYMVPAWIGVLESMPLNPSGKVDRKALPAPDTGMAAAEYVAPRTPVEEVLAGIWSDVLGVERVGVHDGFFDLGGHSLLAARVVSRVREALGVDLPLRTMFDAPQVARFAATVEAARQAGLADRLPPLVASHHTGPAPLSFAQERLWFLQQLAPESPAYHLPGAVRLEGRLDIPALARALTEVAARHDILWTAFSPSQDGDSVAQTVLPPGPLPLPVVDLGLLPEAVRWDEERRLARLEGRRLFDLSRGPLVRSVLLRLGAAEHVLLVTLHHIAADGWSLGLLVRELNALYAASLGGSASPLPALPVRYEDFARWQRSWPAAFLAAELAHWTARLEGAPAVLALPADRPRPGTRRERGAKRPVRIGGETAAAVRVLARRTAASPFMVLLAALDALLQRLTGQSDLVVGSPIAGRDRVELEGLIGCFVNSLALRAEADPERPFRDLVAGVRQAALDAYAHQELPFGRLVEALQPERNLAYTPLFQVLFVLQNSPLPFLDLPGLRLGWSEVETGTAKFDLTLSLEEGEDGWSGTLEYDADLFDATTAERLVERYGLLLAGALDRPEAPLAELPALTAAERQALLVEWNDTAALEDGADTLPALFAAQAARTPDAPALRCGAEVLSFRELDRRATRLARCLRRMGIGPEERVGVLLPRTPRLVVALLAVLRAGGVYVPLDPAYPRQRLALMLEDSGARGLLTERALTELAGHRVDWALCLDEMPEESLEEMADAGAPEAGGEVEVLGDHLAYLIYTSGSTGRPKAVAIRHRSAAVLLCWARDTFREDERRAIAASTSVCFDLSVFELFTPLAWGGTVILLGNALDLAALPAGCEVTLVNTVPSAMTELVRLGAVPSSVRTVALAGEPLPRTLADSLHGLGHVGRVANLYGPSEDTTYSTFSFVPTEGGAPAIGRPLAGTRVYLLDASGRSAPPGVAGEICLGGEGLARGYLGRPDLTAERFVPDPVSGGGRLYRTGDLGRYRADGEIEFLGRIDHQVKVRGFRIELGEVEEALLRLPGVAEAVVVVRGDATSDRRLVGYVGTGSGAAQPEERLRSLLLESLPAYMVPSSLVVLEALPRTPNGKVDRKALPEPEAPGAGAEPAGVFVAPRTALEEILAGIFAEVLGAERVGVRDDFFALGGHSLLAARVASRLRQALGVELPLRRLFGSPTVEALAAAVEELRGSGEASSQPLPPLATGPRSGLLPLSYAQERLWFLEQLEPGSAAYNVPTAVDLEGRLDVVALRQSLEVVVARHESLRTVFTAMAGGPAQRVLKPMPVPLPEVDLTGLPHPEREARRLGAEEAARPFDLTRGPLLLRARLLRLDGQRRRLLLTLHHIVSDGWSMGVLVREIGALYGQGEQAGLPELPVQYADYAAWQRSWLEGETLEREAGFWRQRLAGAPPVLELPTDRPRPAVCSGRGGLRHLELAPELVDGVTRLARRQGATPFMVLLAGFYALLHRVSGVEDLVVGSPVAGRDRSETEGLIGFFVNTLVLRAAVSGEVSAGELVRQARETVLEAQAHHWLPFEKLVELLQPARDLSYTPVFQVMLAYQNDPLPPLDLPELRLRPVEADGGTAKFDLTLSLRP
ncbi:MAG TPA: amino acid adenylation domain-containing protein, partial [Thermoanaerobaculia bacterium]|nr:amino acid adenylation domain-containing protein [Thermoanaerobaculia bacterium]